MKKICEEINQCEENEEKMWYRNEANVARQALKYHGCGVIAGGGAESWRAKMASNNRQKAWRKNGG